MAAASAVFAARLEGAKLILEERTERSAVELDNLQKKFGGLFYVPTNKAVLPLLTTKGEMIWFCANHPSRPHPLLNGDITGATTPGLNPAIPECWAPLIPQASDTVHTMYEKCSPLIVQQWEKDEFSEDATQMERIFDQSILTCFQPVLDAILTFFDSHGHTTLQPASTSCKDRVADTAPTTSKYMEETTATESVIIYNLIGRQLQPITCPEVDISRMMQEYGGLLIFPEIRQPPPADRDLRESLCIYDCNDDVWPLLLWWTHLPIPQGYHVLTRVGGVAGACYAMLQGYIEDRDALNLQDDIINDVGLHRFNQVFDALMARVNISECCPYWLMNACPIAASCEFGKHTGLHMRNSMWCGSNRAGNCALAEDDCSRYHVSRPSEYKPRNLRCGICSQDIGVMEGQRAEDGIAGCCDSVWHFDCIARHYNNSIRGQAPAHYAHIDALDDMGTLLLSQYTWKVAINFEPPTCPACGGTMDCIMRVAKAPASATKRREIFLQYRQGLGMASTVCPQYAAGAALAAHHNPGRLSHNDVRACGEAACWGTPYFKRLALECSLKHPTAVEFVVAAGTELLGYEPASLKQSDSCWSVTIRMEADECDVSVSDWASLRTEIDAFLTALGGITPLPSYKVTAISVVQQKPKVVFSQSSFAEAWRLSAGAATSFTITPQQGASSSPSGRAPQQPSDMLSKPAPLAVVTPREVQLTVSSAEAILNSMIKAALLDAYDSSYAPLLTKDVQAEWLSVTRLRDQQLLEQAQIVEAKLMGSTEKTWLPFIYAVTINYPHPLTLPCPSILAMAQFTVPNWADAPLSSAFTPKQPHTCIWENGSITIIPEGKPDVAITSTGENVSVIPSHILLAAVASVPRAQETQALAATEAFFGRASPASGIANVPGPLVQALIPSGMPAPTYVQIPVLARELSLFMQNSIPTAKDTEVSLATAIQFVLMCANFVHALLLHYECSMKCFDGHQYAEQCKQVQTASKNVVDLLQGLLQHEPFVAPLSAPDTVWSKIQVGLALGAQVPPIRVLVAPRVSQAPAALLKAGWNVVFDCSTGKCDRNDGLPAACNLAWKDIYEGRLGHDVVMGEEVLTSSWTRSCQSISQAKQPVWFAPLSKRLFDPDTGALDSAHASLLARGIRHVCESIGLLAEQRMTTVLLCFLAYPPYHLPSSAPGTIADEGYINSPGTTHPGSDPDYPIIAAEILKCCEGDFDVGKCVITWRPDFDHDAPLTRFVTEQPWLRTSQMKGDVQSTLINIPASLLQVSLYLKSIKEEPATMNHGIYVESSPRPILLADGKGDLLSKSIDNAKSLVEGGLMLLHTNLPSVSLEEFWVRQDRRLRSAVDVTDRITMHDMLKAAAIDFALGNEVEWALLDKHFVAKHGFDHKLVINMKLQTEIRARVDEILTEKRNQRVIKVQISHSARWGVTTGLRCLMWQHYFSCEKHPCMLLTDEWKNHSAGESLRTRVIAVLLLLFRITEKRRIFVVAERNVSDAVIDNFLQSADHAGLSVMLLRPCYPSLVMGGAIPIEVTQPDYEDLRCAASLISSLRKVLGDSSIQHAGELHDLHDTISTLPRALFFRCIGFLELFSVAGETYRALIQDKLQKWLKETVEALVLSAASNAQSLVALRCAAIVCLVHVAHTRYDRSVAPADAELATKHPLRYAVPWVDLAALVPFLSAEYSTSLHDMQPRLEAEILISINNKIGARKDAMFHHVMWAETAQEVLREMGTFPSIEAPALSLGFDMAGGCYDTVALQSKLDACTHAYAAQCRDVPTCGARLAVLSALTGPPSSQRSRTGDNLLDYLRDNLTSKDGEILLLDELLRVKGGTGNNGTQLMARPLLAPALLRQYLLVEKQLSSVYGDSWNPLFSLMVMLFHGEYRRANELSTDVYKKIVHQRNGQLIRKSGMFWEIIPDMLCASSCSIRRDDTADTIDLDRRKFSPLICALEEHREQQDLQWVVATKSVRSTAGPSSTLIPEGLAWRMLWYALLAFPFHEKLPNAAARYLIVSMEQMTTRQSTMPPTTSNQVAVVCASGNLAMHGVDEILEIDTAIPMANRYDIRGNARRGYMLLLSTCWESQAASSAASDPKHQFLTIAQAILSMVFEARRIFRTATSSKNVSALFNEGYIWYHAWSRLKRLADVLGVSGDEWWRMCVACLDDCGVNTRFELSRDFASMTTDLATECMNVDPTVGGETAKAENQLQRQADITWRLRAVAVEAHALLHKIDGNEVIGTLLTQVMNYANEYATIPTAEVGARYATAALHVAQLIEHDFEARSKSGGRDKHSWSISERYRLMLKSQNQKRLRVVLDYCLMPHRVKIVKTSPELTDLLFRYSSILQCDLYDLVCEVQSDATRHALFLRWKAMALFSRMCKTSSSFRELRSLFYDLNGMVDTSKEGSPWKTGLIASSSDAKLRRYCVLTREKVGWRWQFNLNDEAVIESSTDHADLAPREFVGTLLREFEKHESVVEVQLRDDSPQTVQFLVKDNSPFSSTRPPDAIPSPGDLVSVYIICAPAGILASEPQRYRQGAGRHPREVKPEKLHENFIAERHDSKPSFAQKAVPASAMNRALKAATADVARALKVSSKFYPIVPLSELHVFETHSLGTPVTMVTSNEAARLFEDIAVIKTDGLPFFDLRRAETPETLAVVSLAISTDYPWFSTLQACMVGTHDTIYGEIDTNSIPVSGDGSIHLSLFVHLPRHGLLATDDGIFLLMTYKSEYKGRIIPTSIGKLKFPASIAISDVVACVRGLWTGVHNVIADSRMLEHESWAVSGIRYKLHLQRYRKARQPDEFYRGKWGLQITSTTAGAAGKR